MPQNPDIQYLRIRQVEGGVSPYDYFEGPPNVLDSVREITFSSESVVWVNRGVHLATETTGTVIGGGMTITLLGSGRIGGHVQVYGSKLRMWDISLANELSLFDSSELELENTTVFGNVDLTGAGTVTWRGGSYYGSLTDPGNKMDGTSPGDYLNVTP